MRMGTSIAACAAIWASSCARDLDQSHDEAEVQVLGCTPGKEEIGPSKCKSVPPINKVPGTADWPPFVVDGTRTDNEYWGATIFPYANLARKIAGGEVHVNVSADLKSLHVFLDNLPGSIEGEIRIYLDYDRFRSFPDGDPAFDDLAPTDRAFALNLQTGALRKLQPVLVGTTWQWQAMPPPAGFQAIKGTVSGMGKQTRFDAEFRIPLDTVTKDASGRPGVGFAVAQVPGENSTGSRGAFPEQMVGTEMAPLPSPIQTDRRLYQTLIFAKPIGKQLTFMTWNVKRYTDFMTKWQEKLFAPNDFPDDTVPIDAVGRFLSSFDVVALEEGWDKAEVEAIVAAANTRRAMHVPPLPPYQLYGVPDFERTGPLFGIEFDQTNGGIYIMTPFEVSLLGMDQFDDCRGEDCMKAKGVVHARILINRTSAGGGNDSRISSADEFVDVYATDLQDNDKVCTLSDMSPYVRELLGLIKEIPGVEWVAEELVELIVDEEFNCGTFKTNAAVREKQLAQLDAYIEATADPRRPSIVMGSFHVQGRNLGKDELKDVTDEYGKMLAALQLGPTTLDPAADAPDDSITFGGGLPWDVDHADVGRQEIPDATWLAEGRGTKIGVDGEDDPKGKPAREDYIFVRPAGRRGTPEFDRATWMVSRGTSPVWMSPFPTGAGVPTVGNRLSDHKPVISSLELIQMRAPDLYHVTWPHHLTVRVTEVNASGHEDCVFGVCGGLDLFGKQRSITVPLAGMSTDVAHTTGNCGGSMLSSATSMCLDNWKLEFDQDPAVQRSQGAGTDLWEDDDTSANDHYPTLPNKDRAAIFSVNWPAARVELRRWDDLAQMPCVQGHTNAMGAFVCDDTWGDRTFFDNTPQGTCTKSMPDYLCYELSWTETPPGP
jgi:hypothetical protein